MSKHAILSFSFSALLLVLILAMYFSVDGGNVSVSAAPSIHTPPLSDGLSVLAARHGMEKSGLVGEEIVFDPDDFARALNLSTVTAITVTSLPPITDGELRIGSARVYAGQTITRGNLDMLAFVPASGQITDSSFTFRNGESGYDIRCGVHLLKGLNGAPAVTQTAAVSGICEHMTYRGQITVTDPEGDAVRCVLVSPPVHGSLRWVDAASGTYLYIPAAGFAGADTFAIIAVDCWGNTSAQMWVDVRVGVCAVEE